MINTELRVKVRKRCKRINRRLFCIKIKNIVFPIVRYTPFYREPFHGYINRAGMRWVINIVKQGY